MTRNQNNAECMDDSQLPGCFLIVSPLFLIVSVTSLKGNWNQYIKTQFKTK